MTPFAPPERIGFVGLGQMGAPMARNLARAGFTLAVADASDAAVKRFAADVACETPASLAALGGACRAVITMLPDGKVVRDVALMVKDLRIALDVARATGSPVPLGEACLEAWTRAEHLLGGQADHTAAVQYWEQLAGSEIRGA